MILTGSNSRPICACHQGRDPSVVIIIQSQLAVPISAPSPERSIVLYTQGMIGAGRYLSPATHTASIIFRLNYPGNTGVIIDFDIVKPSPIVIIRLPATYFQQR